MFDIGFWELALIGVIALIVVGPEKFPGLIRNVAYWFGRARETVSNLKAEMDMELDKADKLKELMDEQIDIRDKHKKLESGEVESPTGAKPVGTRFVVPEHTQLKAGSDAKEVRVEEEKKTKPE
ncbi:MAG: Sec-independent protein translocase protein TatB [Gammaproteobacteria bacterium]|nr:Sec-independent protein translocase protein TatB [Gammaproteobacteria bacterium]MDH5693387.1 Sec-independent protein translocase protein TatB [Gammaproteobacteria bacterium]